MGDTKPQTADGKVLFHFAMSLDGRTPISARPFGLEVMDLVSVEGPAFILGDLDARMADPVDRSVALEVSRAIERVPELVGFGPHLIATGIRP